MDHIQNEWELGWFGSLITAREIVLVYSFKRNNSKPAVMENIQSIFYQEYKRAWLHFLGQNIEHIFIDSGVASILN